MLAVQKERVGQLRTAAAGVAGGRVRELEQVRRTGIAVNDEELESALRSIAAPVRSRSGQVVAAVNVAIPWSPAVMSELVNRLGPAVQAAANEIGARVV